MVDNLVLLTGATGMIGFRVLTKLLQKGYQVRAAVRNQEGFERISTSKLVTPYRSQLESIIVPDITIPGAYDEAVKGVKYIVHVASPLAGKTAGKDLKDELVRPAIRGTVGMLESAYKAPEIQRVVITSSVASLRELKSSDTFDHYFEAYTASKILSYRAAKDFMSQKNPSFDLINIMPSFVLGRDETVTKASDIARGTNGLLMGPLLGHASPTPLANTTVHVDDVAELHILALDPKVQGGQDFIADANNEADNLDWGSSFDIVKDLYYPEQKDKFKIEVTAKTASERTTYDTANTHEVFGIKFKGFREQIVSVVDHYLELLAKVEPGLYA